MTDLRGGDVSNGGEEVGGPTVPASHARGEGGEDFVGYLLRKLRWGWSRNLTEDVGNGIDGFIFVRRPASDGSPDQIEEGIVAAQVKTGPTYLKERTPDGWWFRLSADQRADWLNRPMAHIVVLVDDEADVAYWAELAPSSMVEAGNNFKLHVPNTQRIDPASAAALRDVLLRSLVRNSGYRGTAWTRPGDSTMEYSDGLAAAVLTPRMIAPHPNSMSVGPVTPVQAVALVCAGRVVELERHLEHFAASDVPDLEAMATATAWPWRLAAALLDLEAATGKLEPLVESAAVPAERAVALIAWACSLARRGDAAAAADLLGSRMAEFSGFLLGWIQVQLARLLRRTGDLSRCRDLLDDALLRVALDQRPPWPTAVLIALRNLQMRSGTTLTEESLRNAVQTADAPPSWWVAQSRSAAFDAHLDELFTKFAPAGSIRFVAEDVARNRLAGGMLSADLAGDEGRFFHETHLAARRIAVEQPADSGSLAQAAELMRSVGKRTEVQQLIRRMVELGAGYELRRLWIDPGHADWQSPIVATATAALATQLLSFVQADQVESLAVALCSDLETSDQFGALDRRTTLELAGATVWYTTETTSGATFDYLVEHSHEDDCVWALRAAMRGLDLEQVRARLDRFTELSEHSDARIALIAAERLSEAGDAHGLEVVGRRASAQCVEAVWSLVQRDSEVTPESVATVSSALTCATKRAECHQRPGEPSTFRLAVHVASRVNDDHLWQQAIDALLSPTAGSDEKAAIALGLIDADDLPANVIARIETSIEAVENDGAWWDETASRIRGPVLKRAVMAAVSPDGTHDAAVTSCIADESPLARQLGLALARRSVRRTGDVMAAIRSVQRLVWDDDEQVRRVAVSSIFNAALDDDDGFQWLLDVLSTLPPLTRRLVARLASSPRTGHNRDLSPLLDQLTPSDDPYIERVVTGRRPAT